MRILPLFLCLLALVPAEARKKVPLYKDPSAPVEARVEDLLSRMTLEEKVAQLQNRFINDPAEISGNLGGKSWGAVFSMDSDYAGCRELFSRIQAYLRDSTRLGIPTIPCAEGIQGLLVNGCTLFPHALAQGSTFNPGLVARMAGASAEEARYLGVRQVLSPVLEIARDLRWGRVEETYGEDPYLIAELAIAFINAYQQAGVACTPKHFVAHGSPTGGMNCGSVSGGPVELHNLYLYPFARVIGEADPLSIMSCYSTYDGVAVTGSHYYLTDLLRGELGFRGYTYSDWGAVERLADFHFIAADLEESARIALRAGLDLNAFWAYYTLQKQVEDGLVDEALVDEAVCLHGKMPAQDGTRAVRTRREVLRPPPEVEELEDAGRPRLHRL